MYYAYTHAGNIQTLHFEGKACYASNGSSIAIKREENLNQGFSRLDMRLMKILKSFSTSEPAKTFKTSSKKKGFFQNH